MVSQQVQPVQTQPCSPDIPQGTAGLGCGAGAAAGRAGWPRCFPSMAGAGLVSNLHVTPLCSCTFHSPDTRVSVLWGRDPWLDACSPRAELGCSCSGCPRGTLRCDTGAALGACGALSKAVDALSGLGSSAVAARSTGRALEGLDPPPGCATSQPNIPNPWQSPGRGWRLPNTAACPGVPPQPLPRVPVVFTKTGEKNSPGTRESWSRGSFPHDKITLRSFKGRQKLLALPIAAKPFPSARSGVSFLQGFHFLRANISDAWLISCACPGPGQRGMPALSPCVGWGQPRARRDVVTWGQPVAVCSGVWSDVGF